MPQSKKSLKTKNSDKANNGQPAKPEGRPLVRAIRVTRELLEAAKAYKQKTGVSFYQLGLQAITERLVKEGFEPSSKA